ncbi:MAG TPA: type III pantothenate kinase [Gammaproteobacteria bacterium]|jgi:type III pantothenate kinase
MIAVIDIGNTRLKWAVAGGTGLAHSGSAVHVGSIDSAVDALVGALPATVRGALAANVAGPGVAAALAVALHERRALAVEFVAPLAQGHGLRLAYSDPSRLGVDRWLAMLAARATTRGPVCVIQAGTAVTFDAVDAAGRHLGGLIIPGQRLMCEALERNTGRIGPTAGDVEHARGLGLLGVSTDEAVAKGALLATAAAIDRAVAAVEAELGTKPSVLLTGGDAERLAAWLETPTRFSADLVLTGLAYIAGSRG